MGKIQNSKQPLNSEEGLGEKEIRYNQQVCRRTELKLFREIISKSSVILGIGLIVIILIGSFFLDKTQSNLSSAPTSSKIIQEDLIAGLEELGYKNIKEVGAAIYGCPDYGFIFSAINTKDGKKIEGIACENGVVILW